MNHGDTWGSWGSTQALTAPTAVPSWVAPRLATPAAASPSLTMLPALSYPAVLPRPIQAAPALVDDDSPQVEIDVGGADVVVDRGDRPYLFGPRGPQQPLSWVDRAFMGGGGMPSGATVALAAIAVIALGSFMLSRRR